jgi:serine/threonine-protein kinase HipA
MKEFPAINNCPGTLAPGFTTYSRTCLNNVFYGKKVSHILPYNSPTSGTETDGLFDENIQVISISGVQEKFSLILDKNKLRLAGNGEQGQYILKSIPRFVKNADQMPANEHLTMQIAQQIFGIETAGNALIFFKNGEPAYITRRFDIDANGEKLAVEDFASLAGNTPQTHGEHYKYLGNYLDLFFLLRKFVPAYKIESLKMLKLVIFNYLFSNGDAHLKNFSLIEMPMGDFKLSPAYDLLNSRIHVTDSDFALDDGLLPKQLKMGNLKHQFEILSEKAEIPVALFNDIFNTMLSGSPHVEKLVFKSFLDEKTKRNYWQSYLLRLKKLGKE